MLDATKIKNTKDYQRVFDQLKNGCWVEDFDHRIHKSNGLTDQELAAWITTQDEDWWESDVPYDNVEEQYDRVSNALMAGRGITQFSTLKPKGCLMSDRDLAETLITQETAFEYAYDNEIRATKNTKVLQSSDRGYQTYWVNDGQYGSTKSFTVFDADTATRNDPTREESDSRNTLKTSINATLYNKLVAHVRNLGKQGLEVGGLLKVHKEADTLHITDMVLLDQEVGGTDFEISEKTLAQFMIEHITEPDFHEWNSWWHSHHTMGLFWSGTDNDMFKDLIDHTNGEINLALGIVFTNDGNFRTRYDIKTPYGVFTADDLTTEIIREGTTDNIEDHTAGAEAAIKEHVTIRNRQAATAYQASDTTRCDEHLENEKLWNALNYPANLDELRAIHQAHKNRYKNWELQDEAYYWGINLKSLLKAEEKKQEREKTKNEKHISQKEEARA